MGVIDKLRGRWAANREKASLTALSRLNGGSMLINTPHEPFLQAWQRNLENTGICSPNILAVSAVYSCVTIISEDVAKLPLRVMQMDGPASNVHANHPIHLLYQNPNSYQTMLEFIQYHIACKLIAGNSYIYMELDARGVCNAMHVLPPHSVRPMIDSGSRQVYYQVNNQAGMDFIPIDEEENPNRIIPSRFIIHDRINTLWHPLIGVSPIYAAATSAATAGRILMNTEKFFGNMSRPSGVLTAPGEISKVTAERLKDQWKTRYSQGNMGETAVLGDGLEWKPIVLNATDSQLIEQLSWTVNDIARAFRVPPHKLAEHTKMTFQNSEQMARDYYQGCLQYHIESTERRFDKSFALANGVYTNFDVDVMFRMDTSARFEAYSKAIASGVMAINEVRAREGLKAVKGGEEPRVQMQYVPLSQPTAAAMAPAPVAPSAATPAPAEPPDDEDDDDLPTEGEDAFQGRVPTLGGFYANALLASKQAYSLKAQTAAMEQHQ